MFNLANRITLARVLFVVPIVILLYFEGRSTCLLAAVLFCVASFTDFLDGHVARRSNTVSSFGKFLDPLADKVLICSVLIMLVEAGRAPAWIVAVVTARELAVTGLRAMAADQGIIIAADRYGKLKTVLQTAAIIPLLIHYPFLGFNPHFIGTALLYAAFIVTVLSGMNYFRNFYSNRYAGQETA